MAKHRTNRASTLTQEAYRLLKHKRTGAPATKKSYYYVMHQVLRGLQTLHCLPRHWEALTTDRVERLVCYWQRKGDKASTIKNRLSVLRQLIGSHGVPDNATLALRPAKKKNRKTFKPFDLNTIDSPIVKTIIELEMAFGLTKAESMQWSFADGLENDNSVLVVHWTLSHNKKRRDVPILNAEQCHTVDKC